MNRIQRLAQLGALGVIVVTTLSLVGPPPAATIWTGVMRVGQGAARPVRYSVPDDPRSAVFAILANANEHDTIAATNVRFDGGTLHFRAAVGPGAVCTLRAVPARGYSGSCDVERGDVATLTMVPPVAGMILPGHELMLAREAAPGPVAEHASVYVLESSGYTEMVRGDNGFTCFIWRPRAVDLWPICHTRDATDALLPVEQLRSVLRVAGLDERVIADSVASGYRTGRFRAPIAGSVGYMLSPHAWTLEAGTDDPSLLPLHLHVYVPNVTNAALGIDASRRILTRVEREGWPDASIIVLAPSGGHP
jgi:hypothetical protein